jgi:hypothetical protein
VYDRLQICIIIRISNLGKELDGQRGPGLARKCQSALPPQQAWIMKLKPKKHKIDDLNLHHDVYGFKDLSCEADRMLFDLDTAAFMRRGILQ